MKKVIVLGIICLFVVSLSACGKKTEESSQVNLGDRYSRSDVYDWGVYTNPFYRYEIRFNGEIDDGSESEFFAGEQADVKFYLKKKDKEPAFIIKGHGNWFEESRKTLEEFYAEQPVNYLTDFEEEEITLGGKKAFKYTDIEQDGKKFDLLIMDMEDHFLEIYIYNDVSQTNLALNTIKFF